MRIKFYGIKEANHKTEKRYVAISNLCEAIGQIHWYKVQNVIVLFK